MNAFLVWGLKGSKEKCIKFEISHGIFTSLLFGFLCCLECLLLHCFATNPCFSYDREIKPDNSIFTSFNPIEMLLLNLGAFHLVSQFHTNLFLSFRNISPRWTVETFPGKKERRITEKESLFQSQAESIFFSKRDSF